jgi:hypothetical protein
MSTNNPEPEQGFDACGCGCKYWTASGARNAAGDVWRCIDCGDRFRPTTCSLADDECHGPVEADGLCFRHREDRPPRDPYVRP